MCFCFKEISSRSVSLPLSLCALHFGAERARLGSHVITAAKSPASVHRRYDLGSLALTVAATQAYFLAIVCSHED